MPHVPVAGSYNSALLPGPLTRTLPLGRSIAVSPPPAKLRSPVLVQVPVVGSYSSALFEGHKPKQSSSRPPASNTLPLRSSPAVKKLKLDGSALPVMLQEPVAGSYCSALSPSTTMTLPFGSSIGVERGPAELRLPV